MAALLWTNVSSLFIWNLFKSVSVYLNCIGSSRVGNGNGGILEIPLDRVQQPGVCARGCQVAEPDPLTNSTLNAAFVCYNRSRCYLWIDWLNSYWLIGRLFSFQSGFGGSHHVKRTSIASVRLGFKFWRPRRPELETIWPRSVGEKQQQQQTKIIK